MSSVELNIDEYNNTFILSGDTALIANNHRAKYYFLDFLKAGFDNTGVITIPYIDQDKEILLKKIQDSLQKYGISQIDSSEIKQVLEHYYTEKENFVEFSEKARRIWYNDVDIKDFTSFKESLQSHLTHRVLYDKQLLAAYHLAFSQNACNFSVPGSGKTSVVYAAYAYLKNLPENHPKHVNRLLIIGPLSSFGPWENEYEECFGEPVKSKRLSGGISREERERYLLSVEDIKDSPEITLMSYQSVAYNIDNLKHFLQRVDNKVMIVLDEAHKIKNVEGGIWASSVLELAKLNGTRSRVVLTGTPIPNGYEDIHNLYEFIWPNKNIINYTTYQLKDMSANPYDARIDRLIDSISPFFIRIRKSDLGLPPAIDHAPIKVKMDDTQRQIYEALENNYLGYFQDQDITSDLTAQLIKARFIRLIQAATNPRLLRKPLESYFSDQGIHNNNLFIDDSHIIKQILNYDESDIIPAKFEVTKELLVGILGKGQKAIIWCTFIQNIISLQSYLADNGIASQLLYGAIPTDTEDTPEEVLTREKIIREFHRDDSGFNVIIANPFAVAESISLHKACHNAIYLERTFNAANFMQSKDRIHRVGLKEGTITNYYYINAEDSIDETVHSRLIEKERRMIELIESRDIPLIQENLNYDIDLKDDLKALIRDYVRRALKV